MQIQPDAAADRLGALPDELLHHLLSFLPAKDVVRTCVLARRWRDLWRFATSLDIRLDLNEGFESLHAAREFVYHLLLLRHRGTPITTCRFLVDYIDEEEDDNVSCIKLWVRHVLMYDTRGLILDIQKCEIQKCDLDGLTLISDRLEVLQLFGYFYLADELLDFSCCPALKKLEIVDCDLIYVTTISSQSLEYLSIKHSIFPEDSRIRIGTPNLHSLHLDVGNGRSPLFQRMPFLVEAFVNTKYGCDDRCDKSAASGYSSSCNDRYGIDGDLEDSYGHHCYRCFDISWRTDNNNPMLLHGLTEAQNLVLKSDYYEMYIFRRDLKWRPIFGNLRTLLLNDYWCVPADFSALAYMLEHSPILEKLTLELYSKGPKYKLRMKGRYNATELSTSISGNLKIIEVKCQVADERVLKVLKFLGTLGISFSEDEVEISNSE